MYASRLDTPGAWFVPFDGQPQQAIDQGSWQRYANGALGRTDSSSQLVRYDLNSAVETKWGAILSVSSGLRCFG